MRQVWLPAKQPRPTTTPADRANTIKRLRMLPDHLLGAGKCVMCLVLFLDHVSNYATEFLSALAAACPNIRSLAIASDTCILPPPTALSHLGLLWLFSGGPADQRQLDDMWKSAARYLPKLYELHFVYPTKRGDCDAPVPNFRLLFDSAYTSHTLASVKTNIPLIDKVWHTPCIKSARTP